MDVQVMHIKGKVAILSWKPVPCCHQNGAILCYYIEYETFVPDGSVVYSDSTVGEVRQITLRELRPNTKYEARVAAVNSAGVGNFSPPVELITPGGKKKGKDFYMYLLALCSLIQLVPEKFKKLSLLRPATE